MATAELKADRFSVIRSYLNAGNPRVLHQSGLTHEQARDLRAYPAGVLVDIHGRYAFSYCLTDCLKPENHNPVPPMSDQDKWRTMVALGVKWPKTRTLPRYTADMSQESKDLADRIYDSMSHKFVDSFGPQRKEKNRV